MRAMVTAEAAHRVEALFPDLYDAMRRDRGFFVSCWDERDVDIAVIIADIERGGARLERTMPWAHPAVGLVTTLIFSTNLASADRVMARIGQRRRAGG